MDSSDVYIGLGANVGDPIAQLRRAIEELLRRGLVTEPLRRSSLYRTAPWGPVSDQPWFINAVVCGKASLPPLDLLAGLKAIERDLGRVGETVRWGPRPVDLDILLYAKVVMNTPELTIPHPRICERAFVLVPLLEIAPDLTDPIRGTSYAHYADLLTIDIGAIEKIPDAF